MKLSVIGALPYDSVREACHLVKQGLVPLAHARRIAEALPERSVLIPAPGHLGYPAESLTLARVVAAEAFKLHKVVFVRPIIAGCRRTSLYDLKKAGKNPSKVDLGLHFRNLMFDMRELDNLRGLGCSTVIIDNVVDTGTTARAMLALVKDALVAAIGDTGNHNLETTPKTKKPCNSSTASKSSATSATSASTTSATAR